MIVEQGIKKDFKPIIITLETEEEAQMLSNSLEVFKNKTLEETAEEYGFNAERVDDFGDELLGELDNLIN